MFYMLDASSPCYAGLCAPGTMYIYSCFYYHQVEHVFLRSTLHKIYTCMGFNAITGSACVPKASTTKLCNMIIKIPILS